VSENILKKPNRIGPLYWNYLMEDIESNPYLISNISFFVACHEARRAFSI